MDPSKLKSEVLLLERESGRGRRNSSLAGFRIFSRKQLQFGSFELNLSFKHPLNALKETNENISIRVYFSANKHSYMSPHQW